MRAPRLAPCAMPRELRVEGRGDMLYRVAPISLYIEGEDIVAYLQIKGTLTDVGIGCGDEEGLLLSGDGRASFGEAPDAARLDLVSPHWAMISISRCWWRQFRSRME